MCEVLSEARSDRRVFYMGRFDHGVLSKRSSGRGSHVFSMSKVVHFAVSYSSGRQTKNLQLGVGQQRVLSKKIRERGREILSMGLCESVHDEVSMQSLVHRSCFVRVAEVEGNCSRYTAKSGYEKMCECCWFL